MKSGYESLVWVTDIKGREYVCKLANHDGKKSFEELSEEEKRRCVDVNQIVGTERW